jgi:phage terminase large subunit GpA-like protein
MQVAELPVASLIESLGWCLELSRAPVVRTIHDWAEAVIRLPNGPWQGQRYRHHRHPFSGAFYREIDSGRWSRFAVVGPTQNGKTLMCYVLPVLYHLFELKETVVVGLPSMDMANDKWSEDFLPVIEASDYRDLLPVSGEGSRGGQVKRAITFRNGATLRFMTSGGGDKTRSGYTTRVVAITEVDGMDESGSRSRESDKIEQLEARAGAFGRVGKRVYLECTASIERGRIWQEVTGGSNGRLLRPCPYCGAYVTPEREHVRGWEDAQTSEQAARESYVVCPACEARWSEEDRRSGWQRIVIAHQGQSVTPAGELVGDYPETQTCGLRWSAIDNPFTTIADLGAEEWQAHRARDRENAERKMRQFLWALPYDPPEVEMTPLDAGEIEQRVSSWKKGVVPDDVQSLVIGVDTGKRMLHWTALAVCESGVRVIEYGKHPVQSDKLGVYRGLMQAMTELAAYYGQGWNTADGRNIKPAQVWVDSGYHEHTDAIYEFCGKLNSALGRDLGAEMYRPTKGYADGQRGMTRYKTPDTKRDGMLYVGSNFHVAKVKRNGKVVPGVMLVHINSDHWKSELHQRVGMPPESALAVTLYQAASYSEHAEFCRHLTAEKQVEKYIEGRGVVIVWERVDRNNHWLDATYAALCAGEAVTFQQQREAKKKQPLSLRDMAAKAR